MRQGVLGRDRRRRGGEGRNNVTSGGRLKKIACVGKWRGGRKAPTRQKPPEVELCLV